MFEPGMFNVAKLIIPYSNPLLTKPYEGVSFSMLSDKNFAFPLNTLKILRPYGTLLDLGVIFNSTAILPRWGSPVRDKIWVEKMLRNR